VAAVFAYDLAFTLKIRLYWHKNLHMWSRRRGYYGFLARRCPVSRGKHSKDLFPLHPAFGLMVKVRKADWFFIVPATAIWLLSLATTAWDFIALQQLTFHFTIISALGIALFFCGVALRITSKRKLNQSYSYTLSTAPTKRLVTSGVYRFIRHPIYFAAIFYVSGAPLVFSSLYGFFVSLVFIPCILYRIGIEEKLLTEEFGEQYVDYKKHTKRLVPFLY
jgi:protein-S-isoprenylcysteine O-methyltransferase Ste14